MSAEAETPAGDPRRDEQELRGDQAGAAARRLCQHHALISLRRSGSSQKHLSVILAVDHARSRMLLDAPHPAPAAAFVNGERLKLHTRLDGADTLFDAVVIGAQSYEGSPALALQLPETMRVQERRHAFRLPLPPSLPRPPSQARAGDTTLPLQLLDVSLKGIGAMMPASAARLDPGDTVELDLALPGLQLLVLAEVRSRSVYGDKLRLGLRFDELAPADLDRLAATLLRLERQLLREQRG